ncbi:membrane protein involved in aromatic hydrocarbon degradation [Defluviimonas sp. 20V17]|nr:membrane protein involved in aromatic hydrocarbon degradation [Defluviimonas sp. 20V17]
MSLGFLALPAHATMGYFTLGGDAVARAQGGAGVAAPGANAMASAINPAAVAGLGREFSLGLEAFAPSRGYDGNGTLFVAPGSVRSGYNVFAIPNFAYNLPLANGAVLNIAAYANGGANTLYPDVANPNCGGATGVFCNGKAGGDLSQLFLSFTYAKKDGNISWGISPTIVGQRFKAYGVGSFAALSSNSGALSGNGYDYSLGFGLRAGLQIDVTPQLSFGLSGQTKMKMSKFKKYAGLFAGGGSFDVPAAATIGMAYKARPDLTLLADFERIFYSGVPALANPYPNGANQLGSANGPGFGWTDVNVLKLGAIWKQNAKMTWRFGYAHATNPVKSPYVTINILAPAVVQNHFTVGGSYKMTQRDTMDFSVMYVPKNSVTGPEVTSAGATTGKITDEMSQFAVSVGWTRTF